MMICDDRYRPSARRALGVFVALVALFLSVGCTETRQSIRDVDQHVSGDFSTSMTMEEETLNAVVFSRRQTQRARFWRCERRDSDMVCVTICRPQWSAQGRICDPDLHGEFGQVTKSSPAVVIAGRNRLRGPSPHLMGGEEDGATEESAPEEAVPEESASEESAPADSEPADSAPREEAGDDDEAPEDAESDADEETEESEDSADLDEPEELEEPEEDAEAEEAESEEQRPPSRVGSPDDLFSDEETDEGDEEEAQ